MKEGRWHANIIIDRRSPNAGCRNNASKILKVSLQVQMSTSLEMKLATIAIRAKITKLTVSFVEARAQCRAKDQEFCIIP